MRDADAKSERPHSHQVVNSLLEFFQDKFRLSVIGSQNIRKAFDVVSSAAPPWNLAQVKAHRECRTGKCCLKHEILIFLL